MSEQETRPDHPRASNRGDSGEVYHRDDERAMGRPAVRRGRTHPARAWRRQCGYQLPTDNGKRATVDPKTGEVHGSGAGPGGGHRGDEIARWTPRLRPA